METNTKDEKFIQAQDKFAEDLRSAAEATGTLIEQGAEELAQTGQQVQAALNAATELARTTFHVVGEQIASGTKAADRVIREKPYQAIGIALAAGLLVGYLIKRK